MPGDAILIVEDEFLIAETIIETLAAAGFSPCAHAATVEEALDVAAQTPLRGALLDIRVGREFVFPVAEALHARNVPFAFTSGFGEVAEMPAAFKAAPMLHKPWADGQLEDIARAVFGR